MRFVGRFIKYLLRSAFSIIVFLLLVGLAKMNRSTSAYITFLNRNDRSIFHRSQLATRVDPFWPSMHAGSGDIADMLSADTSGSQTTGLDVYDPSLEEELNAIPETTLTGSDTGFGFVTTDQSTSVAQTGTETTSKQDLLKIIQKSELNK